jgi:hypothetical protein
MYNRKPRNINDYSGFDGSATAPGAFAPGASQSRQAATGETIK